METLQQLKQKVELIQARIDRLNNRTGRTDEIGKAFYMGRVGGSGRNVHRLNRQRAVEIDRTIDNAVAIGKLRQERDFIQNRINTMEREATPDYQQKQAVKMDARVKYWNDLKPGDKMLMGNGTITVKKKNKKSFTCTSGINWNAAEIIGREAAQKL